MTLTFKTLTAFGTKQSKSRKAFTVLMRYVGPRQYFHRADPEPVTREIIWARNAQEARRLATGMDTCVGVGWQVLGVEEA